MKLYRIIIIIAMLMLTLPVSHAQNIDYLGKAKDFLAQGDCERARYAYEDYKKTHPSGDAEVERRIAECNETDFMRIIVGTTWSYTETVTYNDILDVEVQDNFDLDVKSYFVFTSQTDVIWLFGTPQGNMFPVGFGEYNVSTGTISFAASDKLHKNISLYYGDNHTLIFNFDPKLGTARLNANSKNINIDYLKKFYNNGSEFHLSKEIFTLTPRKDLVGTRWIIEDEGDTDYVYFKSWKEVLVNDRSCAYIYMGDKVSIKSGDDIDDENVIGTYRGENEMTLCREGLDPNTDGNWCGTLRKVK